MSVGMILIYIISAVAALYIIYLILQIMFEGHFIKGLIFFILAATFGPLLYFIPTAIGFVLGYPLTFMSDDLEKRFNKDIYIINEEDNNITH